VQYTIHATTWFIWLVCNPYIITELS